jgi:hypothetical protein
MTLASLDRQILPRSSSWNIRNSIVTIHLDPKAIQARPICERSDGKIPTFSPHFRMSVFRVLVVPPMRREPALLHKARRRGAADCECHETHI